MAMGLGGSSACFVPNNLITAPTDRQRVVMAVIVMVITVIMSFDTEHITGR